MVFQIQIGNRPKIGCIEKVKEKKMHYTFVTEFKLALLVRQEVSEFERQGVETRNVTLFGKLTQQEMAD